jgi:hypothetical protein
MFDQKRVLSFLDDANQGTMWPKAGFTANCRSRQILIPTLPKVQTGTWK